MLEESFSPASIFFAVARKHILQWACRRYENEQVHLVSATPSTSLRLPREILSASEPPLLTMETLLLDHTSMLGSCPVRCKIYRFLIYRGWLRVRSLEREKAVVHIFS